MSKVQPFYSVNEQHKHPSNRVHHDNDRCASGRDIPQWERRQGTGGYRLCETCADYDRRGQ